MDKAEAIARASVAEAERDQLRAKVEKLQAFKDWVHSYLDTHGVPHHPPGTRGEHGCRIGDRMDWLMARMAELREALQPFAEFAVRMDSEEDAPAVDDYCPMTRWLLDPQMHHARRAAELLKEKR